MTQEASRFSGTGSVVLATVNGVVGYGVVRIAPVGRRYEIDRISVRTTDTTSEAECQLFMGQIAPNNYAGGTFSGSSGDTTGDNYFLEDGQALYVVWSGGVDGSTGVVSYSGWETIGPGGFRAVR